MPNVKTSAASPSPVAKYIISGLVGSKATSVHPKAEMPSEIAVQVAPASVDFHNPLAGVQAKRVFELVG